MNSARNKIREQNRQLNKSLESAERTAKLKKEKKSLWAKQSEILFNLAALVFGGAIIGGASTGGQTPCALPTTPAAAQAPAAGAFLAAKFGSFSFLSYLCRRDEQKTREEQAATAAEKSVRTDGS